MRGRRPKEQPGPELKLPKPPKDLDSVARKEWNRLIGKLAGVDERDRALLTAHCMAWSRMLRANAMIAAEGLVVKAKNGYPIEHPSVKTLDAATRVLERTAAKLGLSPFSRGQILTNGTKAKNSGWKGLLAEEHDEVRIADVG